MRQRAGFRKLFIVAFLIVVGTLLLGAGNPPANSQAERARAFTRSQEFDFLEWTLNALKIKLGQVALGTHRYLTIEQRNQTVKDYLKLVYDLQVAEAQLAVIFADPQVDDPYRASSELRQQIESLRAQKERVASLAEAILQDQVGKTVGQFGLTLAGQPIPPVLYHSTPLPRALIISPRDKIRQIADISLAPEITLEERIDLEEQIDHNLDVSSLVVGVGGVGLYPTMVQEISDANRLAEVVAHEWVHNFLTLRPLGINYLSSPALRTMNETTASIAGKEIGEALIKRYYPELAPPPPEPQLSTTTDPGAMAPAEFDFNAEMRNTRVTTDQLLLEGKIEEAEAYMEERRVMFWEQGYRIRKLNQAYFAFYGAYADHPSGGAAGEDPVGMAVRLLRQESSSLADFLNRISWMISFEQLQQALNSDQP